MRLDGRCAIVTGASQGLGVAIAEAYVAAGASVMLCARSAGSLAEVGDRLRAAAGTGQRVETLAADVSKTDDVDALVEATVARLGGIDVLVNNAGVYGPMGALEEVDWQEWVDAALINIIGTVYPCRAVIRAMRARGGGKIVNLSGGGATNPMPRVTAYATSKAAVVRFTESMALELKDDRIDVNAVAPGALATRLLDQAVDAGPDKVGADFHARMVKIPGGWRHALVQGRGSLRLSRLARQRRRDRAPAQRRLGSVADARRARRRSRRIRHLHAPPDRPGGQRPEVVKRSMKIGIVGCGLIGQKRAKSAVALGHEVTIAADLDAGRAAALAGLCPGARATGQWQDVVESDVDAVVIATTHDMLAPIALAAAEAGKHAVVEKPAARSAADLDAVIAASERNGTIVKVGFNHRFHPAMLKARAIVDAGDLGPLLYIRGRYGHGGRPGYDKEWRCQREISGGGELIDQGSHLIDLSRWFLGDFPHVFGMAPTFFWDVDVDDNCFLGLKTAAGQVAWLHASWTEWKNLFSFEIFGRDGKLQVDGLGGSYGVERLTFFRMLPGMGPPETTTWEYPFPDQSWDLEFADFVAAIADKRRPLGDIYDARANLTIVEQVYRGESA